MPIISMHPFIETLSIAGGIAAVFVVAIIVLTLFYRTLSWLAGEGTKPETLAISGVLKKNTWATVHMAGGQIFKRVRFLGVTTEIMPHALHGMVIFEDESLQRYLVRARNIRMIVVAPEAAT